MMSTAAKHLLISTFFFAFMQVCVKKVAHLPAYEVVFFRAFIALILCIAMIYQKKLKPFGTHIGLLILRGICGTFALFFFFYSVQNMPLASAATVQYLSPLFTILLAGIFLKEPARPIQWLFFLLTFIGIALIKGFDPRVSYFVLSIGVLGAISSAAAYNTIRKIGLREDPLVIVFYFPLITFTIFGPYTALNWIPPVGIDWLYLILIGIFVQIAQIFMTKAYQADRAANIVHFNYVGVLFALTFGYFLFGETISLLAFLGISLVVTGISLAAFFKVKS